MKLFTHVSREFERDFKFPLRCREYDLFSIYLVSPTVNCSWNVISIEVLVTSGHCINYLNAKLSKEAAVELI